MHFASFFSGGFINTKVVNPPERKLAKRTSVHSIELTGNYFKSPNASLLVPSNALHMCMITVCLKVFIWHICKRSQVVQIPCVLYEGRRIIEFLDKEDDYVICNSVFYDLHWASFLFFPCGIGIFMQLERIISSIIYQLQFYSRVLFIISYVFWVH